MNKASFSLNKPNPNLNTNLLPVALATMGGFIIGKATGKIVERPIDNFPAGLIGAGVCGAAIIGTTGYYVAKYGGFFDKDRDFKTMFKNM